MNIQPNDIFMNEFSFENVMNKIDRIKNEIEECNETPTDENMKKKDELVWAQFMAGLRLSSGFFHF